MSAENETVGDIAADIRAEAERMHDAWLNDPVEFASAEAESERMNRIAARLDAAWKRAHVEVYEACKRMNDALEKCECVILCAARFSAMCEWSSVQMCDWDGALRAIRKAREVESVEPEGGQC